MAEVSNANNAVPASGSAPQTATGSAGLESQVPGQASTVSGAAAATGGVGPGQFVETDIDEELFQFKSDETPLTQLVLKAKKVKVSSPIVEHYQIDEPRSSVTTDTELAGGNSTQAVLPLVKNDRAIPQPYDTLVVKGVSGYSEDGQTELPGQDLMLFVTGRDMVTGNPIVRATNGPKTNKTDLECTIPTIPAGSTIVLLVNALYETQKEVNPDLIIPQPTLIYAQKRGMNQVVSDYFEAQKKRIPFAQALIAEAQITNFKVKSNHTFWWSQPSKFVVDTKLGPQFVYTTKGIRWQFKKELQHTGKWTIEELIALSKMAFTGEDVPNEVIGLCGKNFLENIQCIDFSKHPEIQISVKTNALGWKVTSIHTVFGDIELKHDPALDRLHCANSAALIAMDRLVHYEYSAEHTDEERVEGEEAARKALIVWDAVGLKGSCHIWIDGEGAKTADGATSFVMWDSEEAPENPSSGTVYYLLSDCKGINANALNGQMWQYKDGGWVEYSGSITAE
jgi:hypothetical protein